jgi:hypothetical protein
LKWLDAGAGSVGQRQVLQLRGDVCCCAWKRKRRRRSCIGSAVMCCAALNLRRWRADVSRGGATQKEQRSRALGCCVVERGSSASLVPIVVVAFIG